MNRILLAQMATMHALNARYDLLVWESDIVRAGLLQKALALLEQSPHVFRPREGKYAGALVMDASPVIPGAEDPFFVLLRSNGTATYYAKDIAFQFWKMGILEGLRFRPYENPYYPGLRTSAPEGRPTPPRRRRPSTSLTCAKATPRPWCGPPWPSRATPRLRRRPTTWPTRPSSWRGGRCRGGRGLP